ncbi:helix-turn-helix transcriptional regulator [Actinoplanes sp. NBC_00393]|uniref:winged helix-turn-helix transcriptional regulator n=1 Tax=Actinoplanes sp. NBC_00393 TaxID=2975953 RepID=UPI002E238384
MRQTSFSGMQCSLAQTLEVIGDWWSPLVLRDLYLGVDRFDDLVRDLGISRNLLTARLESLVAGGVVRRERYQERPARDRYLLTEAGQELVPVLLALTAWGDRWATPEGGPPLLLRHRDCGQPCTPRVDCSACGEPLRADDVVVRPGPGGRVAPGTMVISERLAGVRKAG